MRARLQAGLGVGARWLLLAFWLAHLAAARTRASGDDEDLLPGWKSESYTPKAAPKKVPRMITLHEDARIFLFEHFLSDEECDHIIAVAEEKLRRSTVVSGYQGKSVVDDYRTSEGTFLERGEDDVIAGIEQRIAKWTLLPVGNGEGLQVLRYKQGQKYGAHADYFDEHDEANVKRGGNRFATVLMYLSDVEEGGETAFPNIPAPGGDNGPEFSECARYHLAAKPKKGSAVLFHSIKPNGEFEPRSMHSACPVIKGVKYSAPKWIRVGHFPAADDRVREGCIDRDEQCASWAASGECERNKDFMIGTRARPGDCILACGRCDLVQAAGSRRTGVA